MRLAADLSRKKNIPSVAEKMEIITMVQTNEFWQATDLLIIEKLRKELRDLIKFCSFSNLN